ncbi:hypothetical protein STENM223S_03777 [Streptomyces tendae]
MCQQVVQVPGDARALLGDAAPGLLLAGAFGACPARSTMAATYWR